jgi:hypothetical protein
MPATVDTLVEALRARPAARGSALRADLGGLTQPTFSRLVAQAGDRVVAIGRTRSTRYFATRDIPAVGRAIPLHRVGESGQVAQIGLVHPIHRGGVWVEAALPLPAYLRGERADGWFEGLPYFIDDMRPQGFLGRTFARKRPHLGLPDNPAHWREDDALVALARAGEDCPGELVLGNESLEAYYRARIAEPEPIREADRAARYVHAAAQTLAGTPPGSSAGGEQPKFAVAIHDDDAVRHVLVKFSPPVHTPVGRRSADLLVAELLALETLRGAGFATSSAAIVEADDRTFLEVERFDRVGSFGRRCALTLLGLDNEFFGKLDRWSLAAARLAAAGWLSTADADRLARLELFGRFIANTDMNFGNVSLQPAGGNLLVLAPVYDMLPMLYAPVGDEIVAREFDVTPPDVARERDWTEMGALAGSFWRTVARDNRISSTMREIARDNAHTIDRTLHRFAPAG